MVILTQYHTEIQNRGISTIGASEIFPVSRMPRFQRLHCIMIHSNMHNYRDRVYILINFTDNNHFDPPIYNDFSTSL